MTEATITAQSLGSGNEADGRTWARLVFVGDVGDPCAASSLHALDDIDEVRFRRGARSVERRERVLVLGFPDGRMSSDHGRWLRHDARWVVDDPASKNGTIVDGAVTRAAVLHDGAIVELGHSFFVFRCSVVEAVPAHLATDVAASALPAWPAAFATFSPGLANELAAVVRLAPSTVPIVLLGETGTGKEVIARGIHELSRRPGPLVAVNCGALPPALVESELFGHKRGAFSGAVGDRRGLVRSADKGTLFLDEIGELPVPAQAALLRVLQEHQVVPVGEDRPVDVDLRLVAATLRDLETCIAEDRFRADLYARIAGHVVTLPPLRERREDLGLLLAAMLPRLGSRPVRLAQRALRALLVHDWPHNIRELEQALATAVALASSGVVEKEHLPAGIRKRRTPAVEHEPAEPEPAELGAADRELRAKLVELFARHDGNVYAVADELGKQRSQIYKWIKRLAIDLEIYRKA